MSSDPMRPPGRPEDHDPGTERRGEPDPEQTLELLQALARKQQAPQPAGPPAPSSPPPAAEPAESPLDELARLIGQQGQPPPAGPAEPAPWDEAPPEPEPPQAPPPRRKRRRRGWALLPSRRATLAIGALLVIAVAAVGVASVWWSATDTRAPDAGGADVLAKAMEDCDAEAAKNPETLHFLVIPLTPGSTGLPKWTSLAVQQAGDTYLLLNSKDALAGLRDGSLAAYTGKYAFSIVEPATGTRHSWPPTTGPTKFSEADAGNLTAIKLGFAFGEADAEPKLSAEFVRQKGTCYWVSVLVRK